MAIDREKYRSPEWQENKLKELYYAFGSSEEEGLKLFLNLVFELWYNNPSFLEQVYHTIEEIKAEGIYELSETTLDWLAFWRSYNNADEERNPHQRKRLTALKDAGYLSRENLGRLYFQLGLIEGELKNHENAARNYEEAIRLLPDWSWAHNNLGKVYHDLGRNDEAIVAYKKAIELDPKDAKPYYNLGNSYADSDRKDEAIAVYQQAIELDPKLAQAYNNLGNVYRDLGRKDEAIAAYRKAIELDAKLAQAYNNLGVVYADLGRKDEAIAAYQKAIELDAKLAQAYYNLGSVYRDLGRQDEAIAAYQKAIELDPKDVASHNNLGYLFLLQGQFEHAIAHLKKANALAANHYLPNVNLGITYFHLKDRKNAQAQFRTALEKCPLDAVHGCLNKVTALLGLEQSQEALELLQQTKEKFTIQPSEIKEFFTDWNLLAAAPEPPAGIGEFLERAKEILKS